MTEAFDREDDPRARLDFQALIPTAVPDAARQAAAWWSERAASPLNAFDDNPFYDRECLAVAASLAAFAADLDRRFAGALDPASIRRAAEGCPGPENAAECSNSACRRHGCQGRSPMP